MLIHHNQIETILGLYYSEIIMLMVYSKDVEKHNNHHKTLTTETLVSKKRGITFLFNHGVFFFLINSRTHSGMLCPRSSLGLDTELIKEQVQVHYLRCLSPWMITESRKVHVFPSKLKPTTSVSNRGSPKYKFFSKTLEVRICI